MKRVCGLLSKYLLLANRVSLEILHIPMIKHSVLSIALSGVFRRTFAVLNDEAAEAAIKDKNCEN
jgi:hypothetical protein